MKKGKRVMKWGFIAGGALVALVLIITFIGLLLPKAHIATRKIQLSRPASTVFSTITDWQAYPTWRNDVESVAPWKGPDGSTGWIEKMKYNEIPLQILESTAPDKLVVKIADPKLPFGGIWTYDVKAVDDTHCTLTITEAGEVYNPIFRFVSRFIMGHTATMDAYLKAIGKKFGQEITFE